MPRRATHNKNSAETRAEQTLFVPRHNSQTKPQAPRDKNFDLAVDAAVRADASLFVPGRNSQTKPQAPPDEVQEKNFDLATNAAGRYRIVQPAKRKLTDGGKYSDYRPPEKEVKAAARGGRNKDLQKRLKDNARLLQVTRQGATNYPARQNKLKMRRTARKGRMEVDFSHVRPAR